MALNLPFTHLHFFKRFYFRDLMHLVFPEVCLICSDELAISEHNICSICSSELTETNFDLMQEASEMDQLFWGRIPIENTYAHLFFKKHKGVQHVLFALKYRHRPQLGVYFGNEIGKRLMQSKKFSNIDAIIPVPLHPKKAFLRGYNQSEALAKGLAAQMNLFLDTYSLTQTQHGESQTKKSRFQRWDNVQNRFHVKKSIRSYKHILLVDDVITTGATLETISNALRQQHPDLMISIATLAIA